MQSMGRREGGGGEYEEERAINMGRRWENVLWARGER